LKNFRGWKEKDYNVVPIARTLHLLGLVTDAIQTMNRAALRARVTCVTLVCFVYKY